MKLVIPTHGSNILIFCFQIYHGGYWVIYHTMQSCGSGGVSEEYETVAMIAFGYLGKVEDLPEKIRERAEKRSSRMEIEDFTFKGKWRNSVDK